MPRGTISLEDVPSALGAAFDQAQTSVSGHRKNCVTLFKLQKQSATITEKVKGKGGSIKLVGERLFSDTFLELLNRILVVKKGVQAADRVTKFIATYVRFMNEKVFEAAQTQTDNSATAQRNVEDEESFASRLSTRLLKHLMKGFSAKNKVVRFRSTALTAELISSIPSLDDGLYTELRSELLMRLHDKESIVRSQACIALSRLAAVEDPADLPEGEDSLVETLLDALVFDQSPEVRRLATLNVPLNAQTIPSVLTRTHDVDPITRKVVFSTVIPRVGHPKLLTMKQREIIVRHGLGDREETVRVAAVKLLTTWLDILNGDLIELLNIFDFTDEGGAELAADVLNSLFSSRTDIFDTLEIDESFWRDLTAERALLIRVYIEHAKSTSNEHVLACFPVVTAFAFHIQGAFNAYLELVQEAEEAHLLDNGDEEEQATREAKMEDASFVMSELLRVATGLDYTDELGRRKMFAVIREILAHPSLPENRIGCVMDVLQILSASERDLIRVIVEGINELRYPSEVPEETEEPEQDSSMQSSLPQIRQGASRSAATTPEGRLQEDYTSLRCLALCIAMLERVNGSFDENSTLEGVLSELIVPAVKRKEPALREKGLVALGLTCLIARSMAPTSLPLFLGQIQSSPEKLKGKILQVVFDMLMVHERDLLSKSTDVGGQIITFLLQSLEAEEYPSVQAIICTGFSKLLLCGLIADIKILTSLVLVYVSPETMSNLELRQALSYFFPVYAYSSVENQSRLQSIFINSYDLVNKIRDELEEDQQMIGLSQFTQLFVDWTDPLKVVNRRDAHAPARDVHVDFAIDILKAVYNPDRDDEDRKILCQILPKLYIPENPVQEGIWSLNLLLSYLQRQSPIEDPAVEKITERFQARFNKQHKDILDKYDEQKCLAIPAFRELYEFIGLAVPRDAHATTSDTEVDLRQSAVRRQRSSMVPLEFQTTADESSSESGGDPTTPTRPRPSPALSQRTRKAAPTPPSSEEGDNADDDEAEAEEEPEEEQASEEEPEPSQEPEEVVAPPTTPKRPARVKRNRSPAQTRALKSPARKRHHSGQALRPALPSAEVDIFRDTSNTKPLGARKTSAEISRRKTVAQPPASRDSPRGPRRVEDGSDGDFDI